MEILCSVLLRCMVEHVEQSFNMHRRLNGKKVYAHSQRDYFLKAECENEVVSEDEDLCGVGDEFDDAMQGDLDGDFSSAAYAAPAHDVHQA